MAKNISEKEPHLKAQAVGAANGQPAHETKAEVNLTTGETVAASKKSLTTHERHTKSNQNDKLKAETNRAATGQASGAEVFSKTKPKRSLSAMITKIAVLSAISVVLYLLRFKLPIFPSFLDIQFSDLPALLGGFAMGPVSGCLIILCRGLLKLLISGTETAFIGDLADLILGCVYVVASSLIYRALKTKKGAAIALTASSCAVIAVSVLLNRFVLVPFYLERFTVNGVMGALNAIFPDATAENLYSYYLPLSVLPFNALRCLITSTLCFFVYKRTSPVLHM